MISFRFKAENFIRNKLNHKFLAIRDLFAKIYLDGKIIGEIQCYYLDYKLILHDNKDFINFGSDFITEDELEFMKKNAISTEDEYSEYISENYMSEDYFYDFIYDNDIEIVNSYLKQDKDILFIKKLNLFKDYSNIEIYEDLKYTLYILFDYQDFITLNNEGHLI